MEVRTAEIERKTKETAIRVSLDLDGKGKAEAATGIPFFDHMTFLKDVEQARLSYAGCPDQGHDTRATLAGLAKGRHQLAVFLRPAFEGQVQLMTAQG